MDADGSVVFLAKDTSGAYKVRVELEYDEVEFEIDVLTESSDPAVAVEEVRQFLYAAGAALAKRFEYAGSLV